MTIELLSRQELQLLNKKGLKYPLAVAEKDYFLAVVLKILYHSSLKDVLVFKGGTALYHTYLPQLRFSQDLDFTALRRITVDELKSLFAEHDFLEVKKHYTSGATVKFDLSAIVELLNRKEIRKPISLNNILEHWRLASQAKAVAQIYVTQEISDEEVEAQLKRLPLD